MPRKPEPVVEDDVAAPTSRKTERSRPKVKQTKSVSPANEEPETHEETETQLKKKKRKQTQGLEDNKVTTSLEEGPKKRQKAKAEDVETSTNPKPDKVVTAPISVSAYREANQIKVGRDCPDPFQTFDSASSQLGKTLAKALRQQGYEKPTPIQAQAWPIALQGRDMIAVAKTGSGKTCGFLLPALVRIAERGPAKVDWKYPPEPARPSVLVLAPTRELAQQIAVEAEKFAPAVDARVVAIYGGVPKGDQVREVRNGCDILIATPGRLLDLEGGDPKRNAPPAVSLERVTYLVLDEADRMLDMGFEPDIRTIVSKCPKTGKPEEGGGASGLSAGKMRQTLYFTATWPKAVQKVAAEFTSKSAVQVNIGQGDGETLTANANVTQVVHVLEESEKPSKLKEVLASQLAKGETAIVFAGQKKTCDDVAWDLQKAGLGLWCRCIHSGKEQWNRDEALAKFRELTAGKFPLGESRGVLVATDVAARGLDIPGVALIVIYDFGRAQANGQNVAVESYVHRIGRTGRAGKHGRAVTFFTCEDQGSKQLIEILRRAKQEVPKELEAMVWQEEEVQRAKDQRKSYYKKSWRGGRGGGHQKGSGRGRGGWK